MLKTRIITMFCLLTILLPILLFNNFFLFIIAMLLFLSIGIWECLRLFYITNTTLWTIYLTMGYILAVFMNYVLDIPYFFILCVALWVTYFILIFIFGLLKIDTLSNHILSIIYILGLFECFTAAVVLFQHSPLYLLSIMMIVWVADISAYCIGKIFGRHRLASSISPDKSWEGVIGGWLVVLIATTLSVIYFKNDTFLIRLYSKLNWYGFIVIITLLVAISVIGDLFESQLKRRANTKDSSNLLPGHGGVLDRIDSMIPVLPLAILVDFLL